MKVIVGGGSGFVGRARLVASLLADGAEVAVLSRRPSRSSGPGRVGRDLEERAWPPREIDPAPTRSSTWPASRSGARAGRGGARR